jgi:intracellular septation protein
VSTDTWVSFKAFGFLPLTFLFALSQMPLMQRYSDAEVAKTPGEMPKD